MKQYPYRYDLHVHTAEVSKCAWLPGGFLADLYQRRGYAGFAVTDHLYEDFAVKNRCESDWAAYMDRYLTGYREARRRGEALGLDVILGAEVRFPENKSDYLLYGIDEAFLYRNPFLYRLNHRAFFDRYGSELLIIHAHPYRDGNQTVYFDCVHGVEVVNGCSRHKNENEKALDLARRKRRLLPLAGSDTHRPGDEGRCAVLLASRAADSRALKDALLRRDYRLDSSVDAPLIEEANALLADLPEN